MARDTNIDAIVAADVDGNPNLPGIPDIDVGDADMASAQYSQHRTKLSAHRTALSENRSHRQSDLPNRSVLLR
jgi:hypothetical protein